MQSNMKVETGWKEPLSLERQARITAGLMLLTGVIGHLYYPPLLYLAGFVGLGLIFAGISGICGLTYILRYLPWNRNRSCSTGTVPAGNIPIASR